MSLVEESEWNDYRAALKKHGHDETDFDVSELREPARTAEVDPITGTVMIRHKRTLKQKAYLAGWGSTWVVDFDDDLANGSFR